MSRAQRSGVRTRAWLGTLRGVWAVAVALAGRPGLWLDALAAAAALAPERWWRRRPFLPLPDASYWRFRMITAYGGAGDAVPEAHDVLQYLEWRRRRRCSERRLR